MENTRVKSPWERMKDFSLLPPKDREFYDLCDQMATHIMSASNLLMELFETKREDRERRNKMGESIAALETEGDKLVKLIMHYLMRVQQPPFNRDDINDLIHQLDDILDRIKASATVFIDREFTVSDATMVSMARNIHEACRQIAEAVHALPKQPRLEPYVDAVKKFEGQSDDEFHAGFRRRSIKVQDDNIKIDAKLDELQARLASAGNDAAELRGLLSDFYSVLAHIYDHSRHTALFAFLRDEYEALERANNSCYRAMVTLNRLVVSNG